MNRFRALLVVGLVVVLVAVGCDQVSAPTPVVPVPVPVPGPGPHKPKPCPPHRPWGPRTTVSAGRPTSEDVSGGKISSAEPHVRNDMLTPAGRPMQLEFPRERHKKNVGGSDGAGLCVFCSMSHAGDWSQESVFYGIFEWMRRHPGGGYPEKVDAMVKRFAAEKRMQIPAYIQYEGTDLSLLQLACENGFMPSVTYNYSPTGRYNGSRIAHMVTCCHCDSEWTGIIDNNYPGSVEWMPTSTFLKVATGGRSLWYVILLHDGPPPAPHSEG